MSVLTCGVNASRKYVQDSPPHLVGNIYQTYFNVNKCERKFCLSVCLSV